MMPVESPSIPRWLVGRCLNGDAQEAILGDLEERLRLAVARGDTIDQARRAYWREAFMSILAARRWPKRAAPQTSPMPGSRFGVPFRGWGREGRYVCRGLARSPAFVLVAVLSLAIGIGANVTIANVIRQILLQDLPVTRPAELHWVTWQQSKSRRAKVSNFNSDSDTNFSYPAFVALEHAAAGRAELFGFNFARDLTVSADRQPPRLIDGVLVSSSYFQTLGLAVERGRPLGPADDHGPPVTVISHRLWLRVFGGDNRAVGQTLRINGVPFEIVGVTPAAYRGLSVGGFFPTTDVTVPLSAQPVVAPRFASTSQPLNSDLNRNWIRGMVRVPAGADAAGLAQTFAAVFQRLEDAAGGADAGWHATVGFPSARRGLNTARDRAEQPLTILAIISGLVLILACTNLAGLMLARGLARERDVAVRRALGASRAGLIRQWVFESLFLALAGGTAGVVAAAWSGPLIARMVTAGIGPTPIAVGVDWPLISIACGITVVTAIGCALVPAIRLTGDRVGDLRTRIVGGEAPKVRMGRLLIVAQVTISVPLLLGAILFLRTLHNLGAVALGFDANNLVLFDVNPTPDPKADPEAMASPEQVRKIGDLLGNLEAIPGVVSATVVENALVSGWVSNTMVTIENTSTSMLMDAVGPGFFDTMRIPILAGRALTLADNASAPPVVVINQAAADRYFPNQSPVGRTFLVGQRKVDIVGVAANSLYDSLRRAARPMLYDSYLQRLGGTYMTTVAVRTSVSPDRLEPSLRAAVAAADPDLPIAKVRSEQDQIDESTGKERVFTRLLTLFGGFALLLVCVGLHGLTSYAVTRRTGEIGIRLALGAQREQVLWMILRQVVALTGVGLVVGVPAAVAVSHHVAALLFGVAPKDPFMVSAAMGLMLVVSIVAGWVPARRAARMEALAALRQE